MAHALRNIDKPRTGEIYAELLLNSSRIKEVFDEYDRDSKGYLNHDDVLRLLKNQEMKTGRDVNGVVSELVITRADIPKILTKAKIGTKKKIKQKHLVPILAAWEEMAEKRLQEKKENSCGCQIL